MKARVMQLEAIFSPLRAAGSFRAVPACWHQPLARVALAWAAIIALTYRDWLAMADQWWNISTYNHILFVPVIVGWLMHSRWHELAKRKPEAWAPGLVLVAGALFIWLVGSLAGVNTIAQLGAVAALQLCIPTLLGPRIAAASLFPLAYMFFLVPFGDELVPTLQGVTAELVIGLTHWSGIPAVIDGVFIDTPVGLFEVAEACSGVKFLIAMVALGTLVSYCCFTRWRNRIVFMLAAVAISILANGVRAWGTIYIAQSQGVEFAEGFDHIFYGWVFFAVIVAALIGGAWRWFDREPDDVGIDCEGIEQRRWFTLLTAGQMDANRAIIGLFLLLAATAIWHLAASRLEAAIPDHISLPQTVKKWKLVDYDPKVDWRPRASGAEHRLLGRYRTSDGVAVDVFLAFYAAQEEGREASAYGEGALDPETDWRWLAHGESTPEATANYYFIYGQFKRLAETSYRTGDLLTGSAASLKLANMRDRLLLRRVPTMLIILSAEEDGKASAKQSIDDFRRSIGNEAEWIDRIVGLR